MKKIYSFIVLVVLAAGSYSQTAGTASNIAPASTGTPSAQPVTRVGKIEIPPEKARPVNIPKVGIALSIDGRIDEEAWKNAAVFKDFYQTSPGDNVAPSKPTEVYMMYDEKHLYVAFKCWDEKDKIRATVAKRDAVTGEDNVRMWLDTYNDKRRAYVVAFNPFGIQQDGIYTEGSGADFSVDIVMESKGVIEEWGWSVEAKIPFKSLRYSAGKGKFWGFNVARNIDRFNDEFDQWLPDDRNVSGFLSKFGTITGLDDIKWERTLEVAPSVTISESGRRTQTFYPYERPGVVDPGRFFNDKLKADVGVNVKYTLTPSITLDAAINPDYAEIEADAPVVTANQRFPIFFQEKRPFFLEGADIFNSPLNLFYSRNIVDPDVAVKLTGKVGKTTFGFLGASDNAPGNYSDIERGDRFLRPRIDEFLDKNALFGVLRIKRDFGKENNIGFFGTYRDFPEQKNLVGGFDGKFKFTPRLTSTFQVVGSNSRRCITETEFEPSENPQQTLRNEELCGGGTFDGVTVLGSQFNRYRTGNGLGYYFNLDYTTDKHGWFFEMGGRSKYYRADSGFTRRVNTNFAFFINRFSTKSKPKAKVIRVNWAQFSGVDYDWKGRLQGHNLGTNFNISLQKSTFLFIETGIFYEKLYEEEFGLKRMPSRPFGTFFGDPTRATWQHYTSANLNQTVNKKFNYGFFVGMIRNNYDYFGVREFVTPDNEILTLRDPGPGIQFDAEIFGEYKPIDPLRISASYRKSRLVRNDNRVRAFDSDIVSIRSTYQFTRFMFTRFRLDYNGDDRNFSGQALFGWSPNPGTAFYAGYNDDFNYNGFSPLSGFREPGFERNGRTFFIRASYLFRKSF